MTQRLMLWFLQSAVSQARKDARAEFRKWRAYNISGMFAEECRAAQNDYQIYCKVLRRLERVEVRCG